MSMSYAVVSWLVVRYVPSAHEKTRIVDGLFYRLESRRIFSLRGFQ